jgi:transposase
MSGVARLFKVSVQAVLKWIRAASDRVEEPQKCSAEVVQVDEMWHFVNGKKTKFGSGERFVGHHAELSDGTSVIVLTRV